MVALDGLGLHVLGDHHRCIITRGSDIAARGLLNTPPAVVPEA